jgi:hypothetical protein
VALEIPTASETPEKATGSARRGGRTPTWPAVMLRAYDFYQRGFEQQCLQEADVAIRVFTPPRPMTNFDGGPQYVEAGERAVEAAVERLRILLPWVRS